MKRFNIITDNLYRGSAPTIEEVKILKKHLGINKIVSLDKESGEHITKICNKLNITHIMLPLDGSRKSLMKLLKKDLWQLLIEGGPTFIHCAQGKDRTGLVSAMFRCLYMGWNYKDALQEALNLGFGVGVDPEMIKNYVNVIKNCSQESEDENIEGASIVSNQRNSRTRDGRGSYLDQASQGSFAPHVSRTRQHPYDNSYNYINDQYPTRNNLNSVLDLYKDESDDALDLPVVGVYDSSGGVKGFGPVEPLGGFING